MRYEVFILNENTSFQIDSVKESDAIELAEILTNYGFTVTLTARPKEGCK